MYSVTTGSAIWTSSSHLSTWSLKACHGIHVTFGGCNLIKDWTVQGKGKPGLLLPLVMNQEANSSYRVSICHKAGCGQSRLVVGAGIGSQEPEVRATVRKPIIRARGSEPEPGTKARKPVEKQCWSRLGKTGTRLEAGQAQERLKLKVRVEQPEISCHYWV